MNAVIPGTSLAIHPENFPDPIEDLPVNGHRQSGTRWRLLLVC